MNINRNDLLKAIEKVSVVIKNNPITDILNYILVDIKDQRCNITATDLEVTMTYSFDTDIKADISFCVDPTSVKKLFSELEYESIEFIVNKDNILFQYGLGSNTQFPLMPADEFPAIKEDDEETQSFTIDGSIFKDLLYSSKGFTSNDDMRPIMTCINIEVDKNSIRSVATDAHMLTTMVMNHETTIDKDISFMVPHKAVIALLKMPPTELTIVISENNITYKTSYITVKSTVVQGKYPNWKPVIPVDSEATIKLLRYTLLKGIKIASFTSSNINKIIVFRIKNKKMSIISDDTDYSKRGEFKINLINNTSDEEIVVGFNQDILKQVISSIKRDIIEFNLSVSKACTIGSIDSHLVLIMPMVI